MTTRTNILATIGLLLVGTTAGCGFITGSQPATFSATKATVQDATYEQTGYNEVNATSVPITRTFQAAGQERTVNVTNQLAQYQRQIDAGVLGEQRAAVFIVFTSPKIELFGQTFNPLDDMSNRELLNQLQSQYDGLTIGDKRSEQQTTMLSKQTTVETYDGSGTFAGASTDLTIHITRVEHNNDFVIALAIYPTQLSEEEDNAITMINNIKRGP